jgi:hypothetical protein
MKTRFWAVYFGIMILSLSTNYLAISDESSDLKTIVAGLKNYNELIQSGEADIIHKSSQYNMQGELNDSMVMKSHLTFDGDKTLFEFEKRVSYRSLVIPKETCLIKKTGELSVSYDSNNKDLYFAFRSDLSLYLDPFVMDSDPRHLTRGIWNMGIPSDKGIWPTDTFSKYIVKKGFTITSKEVVDGTMCYVLEARNNQEHEKIWIAPERGFGYLKRESWGPSPSIPWIGLEKGTPGVVRTQISYHQSGGAWFPEKELTDVSWIDAQGKEHLIRRKELEVKNLRLNCRIPADKFVVIEIPDGATIWAVGLNKYISKEEFLKLYSAFIKE